MACSHRDAPFCTIVGKHVLPGDLQTDTPPVITTPLFCCPRHTPSQSHSLCKHTSPSTRKDGLLQRLFHELSRQDQLATDHPVPAVWMSLRLPIGRGSCVPVSVASVPRRTMSFVTGMMLSSHLECLLSSTMMAARALNSSDILVSGGFEHQVSLDPRIFADKVIGRNVLVLTHMSLLQNQPSSPML